MCVGVSVWLGWIGVHVAGWSTTWFDVCWGFGVVELEWYPCCRLKHNCASACNTDTTPTQPHQNSRTHRTKNNTTNVVIQQNSCKLLMMDILMSETCWAHKKWNKIASDIKLVFYSSTITMMHGPIYIRLMQVTALHSTCVTVVNLAYKFCQQHITQWKVHNSPASKFIEFKSLLSTLASNHCKCSICRNQISLSKLSWNYDFILYEVFPLLRCCAA